ncbi:hypothetical protein [Microtetraspora sp. NBRC 16547]|nr:hypothetical protein [Microtetraspora sp. NBRC 16547]
MPHHAAYGRHFARIDRWLPSSRLCREGIQDWVEAGLPVESPTTAS